MLDQRHSRRFPLKLHLKLVFPRSVADLEGETCNVSSKGVAFTGDIDIEPGEYIEYVIELLDVGRGAPVRLHCTGKLLRKQKRCCAATLDRYVFVRESED